MDAAEGSLEAGPRSSQRTRFAAAGRGFGAPKRNMSFRAATHPMADEAMDESAHFHDSVTFDDDDERPMSSGATNAHNRSMVDIFLSEDVHTKDTGRMMEHLPSKAGSSASSEGVSPIKRCLFYAVCGIALVIIFISVPRRGHGTVSTLAPSQVESVTLSPSGITTEEEEILIEEESEPIANKPTTTVEEDAPVKEEQDQQQPPVEEVSGGMTRSEAMEAYILELGVSNTDDLINQDSPSYKALRWIANDDPANLDIPGYQLNQQPNVGIEDVKSFQLMQRYALKCFHFAIQDVDLNQGQGRRHLQNGAAAAAGEEHSSEDIDNRMKFDDTWKSGDNVCDWYGITCDNRGFVTELHLSNTMLEGTLVPEIFQEQAMMSLVSLELSFNKFEGTFPTQPIINDLIQEIWLDHNHLEGPIQDIIRQFKKLIQLDIQDNRFTGALPQQWSHLAGLKVVKLSVNHLEGPVPTGMGKLTSMEWFQLDKNKLTGTIPTELASMPHLHTIKLANNILTGTLPESLADLPLAHLSVEGNRLTGEIPVSYGKLSRLEDLHLQQNDLEGVIPEEVCSLTGDDKTLQQLTADCKEPKVECSCCTSCY